MVFRNFMVKFHAPCGVSMNDICPIIAITNARTGIIGQTSNYIEPPMKAMIIWWDDRKKYLKKSAFEIVADQTGKLMNPNVFTIVWARRFAGYKRAELITRDTAKV